MSVIFSAIKRQSTNGRDLRSSCLTSRRRAGLHGAGHDRDRVGHRVFGGVDDRDAAAEAVDVDAVGDLEGLGAQRRGRVC
jgi:hypothetical protein